MTELLENPSCDLLLILCDACVIRVSDLFITSFSCGFYQYPHFAVSSWASISFSLACLSASACSNESVGTPLLILRHMFLGAQMETSTCCSQVQSLKRLLKRAEDDRTGLTTECQGLTERLCAAASQREAYEREWEVCDLSLVVHSILIWSWAVILSSILSNLPYLCCCYLSSREERTPGCQCMCGWKERGEVNFQ